MIATVEHYTCQFYRMLTGEQVNSLDDIPTERREILMLYSLEELIRPMVRVDLEEGELTLKQLARKYGTSVGRIRQMGRKMGYYKKYPRCK